MHYDKIAVPADGEQITVYPDGTVNVPERPIIPFIEGDGIGVDVTPVMRKVVVNTIACKELVPGVTLVGTSRFGDAVIRHMDD